MRVKIISSDPREDPLLSTPAIPQKFQAYFLPNTERMFYYTSYYGYLEQRYVSKDCIMCYLDFEISHSCSSHLVADEPMLTILYMLKGSVDGHLSGYGDAPLRQGSSYLIYLPREAVHQAYLLKGHLRVMYCYVLGSFLDNIAIEHEGIADLLLLFNSGSPVSLIEKPAAISYNALYQMWLVAECRESRAIRAANLRARGLDLVMDYMKQQNKRSGPVKDFAMDVLSPGEKIFQAKGIIDDKEEGKLYIHDLARMVGLNEQQLKRGFKEAFRITIGKYEADKRFSKACRLLADTNLFLSDIAEQTGYRDLSSLIRVFQNRLQTTPHQFRLKAGKKF